MIKLHKSLFTICLTCALAPVSAYSQRPTAPVAVPAAATSAASDPSDTQEKLMSLLRVTPTLSNVVASDPTLLADQEYVSRMNPELGQFLQQHPEVARNPTFYLFSDLSSPGKRGHGVLTPKEGFERERPERSEIEQLMNGIAPIMAMGFLCFATVWLVRLLTQNRRWKSMFAMQSETHAKLIDRLGTSQELLAYLETDAGRRLLDGAPIAAEFEQTRMPNVVSRVFAILQTGIVLTLLGVGLLAVRNHVGDGATGMLVLGMLALMPGIGCIVSAAVTWVLAGRLGLMPSQSNASQARL